VVSAGYRNRFGHPAPAVTARYDERGIAWVDSPRCGAATWRSDQPIELRCERERRRRYWHHKITESLGPVLAILPGGERTP